MEVRAASRGERDEVLDLLSLWYDDREFFARYNQLDPTFRDALCLVARDGGRLVSTVQIFDRAINLSGQSVPMGGIGSVFTLEEYRHRGVASALMRLAVDTMFAEGFELSLLFAERLTFYNQFGWREVERKFSILAGAAGINAGDVSAREKYVIDVFETARDLAAVAEIHREYSGRFNVAAIRDDAAWRANLEFAGNQPMRPGEGSKEYFVVCREAEKIAAYARVARFHGVAMVMEFGYLRDGCDAMLATFKFLGEGAARVPISFRLAGDHRYASVLAGDEPQSAGLLITHTAHDPELEQSLAGAGCPAAHHVDNNYMWRVLAPEKIARRFETTPEAATAQAFETLRDSRSLFWTADRF
jgi:GNAT superfamily N-acetyltransferase